MSSSWPTSELEVLPIHRPGAPALPDAHRPGRGQRNPARGARAVVRGHRRRRHRATTASDPSPAWPTQGRAGQARHLARFVVPRRAPPRSTERPGSEASIRRPARRRPRRRSVTTELVEFQHGVDEVLERRQRTAARLPEPAFLLRPADGGPDRGHRRHGGERMRPEDDVLSPQAPHRRGLPAARRVGKSAEPGHQKLAKPA